MASVGNEKYLKKLSVYDWSHFEGDDSFDRVFQDLVIRHINRDNIQPFGVYLLDKPAREVQNIILHYGNVNHGFWLDVCGKWRDTQGAKTWGWLIERLDKLKEEEYNTLSKSLQKRNRGEKIKDRDLLDLWKHDDFPFRTPRLIKDFAKNAFGMKDKHVDTFILTENKDLKSQIWELVNYWRRSSPDSTAYNMWEAMKDSEIPLDTCAEFADQLCKNKKYKLITDEETGHDEPDTHKAEPQKEGAKKLTPEEKPTAAGDAASSSRSTGPGTDGLDEKLVARIKSEIMVDLKDSKLEHIQGLEHVKEIIKNEIIKPLKRPDLYKGQLRKPPRGVLLYGPPGNGKTEIGKCIAIDKDIQATFYRITTATLLSKYVGESAQLAKTLFHLARAEKMSIIFIDEVDGIMGSRKDERHEATTQLTNELLAQWDGITKTPEGGCTPIVMGATNRPWDIDEAHLSRFEVKLLVPPPDAEARKKMIINLLVRDNLPQALDEQQLTDIVAKLDGYSGRNIKDICRRAAMKPLSEIPLEVMVDSEEACGRQITHADFLQAIEMVPKTENEHKERLEDFDRSHGTKPPPKPSAGDGPRPDFMS